MDLAEALNIFMRDFGSMGGFESLFGGGRPQADSRRGQDIRVAVKLTLQEVATSTKRTVKLKTMLKCEACGGSGSAKGKRPTGCSTCGGSGEVRRATRSVFGQFVSVSPCPTCGGEGIIITNPCEACRGDGRVRGERTVPVDIPAGVSSNNYITLRGQGAAGPRNGPNGDLLITIEVKDDERFERHGDDLSLDLPLSFGQAALGITVSVPTPYGGGAAHRSGGCPVGHGASGEGQGTAAAGPERLGRSERPGARLDPAESHRRAAAAAGGSVEDRGRSAQGGKQLLVPPQGGAGGMSWCALDVLSPPESRDAVATWLVSRTGQAVEERGDGTLVSFAESEAEAGSLLGELRSAFGAAVDGTSRPLPDVDWSRRWRDGLGPRVIGRLTVTPSWAVPVDAGPATVIMDPRRPSAPASTAPPESR